MSVAVYRRSVCTTQSIMMSPSRLQRLFGGGLHPMGARMAVTEFRQRLGPYELQAFGCVVAMDFLHIELAHEVDGLLGDDLPRHHDRETRRIGDHEIGRDEIRAILQARVDVRIGGADCSRT